jgi:methyl-accepting chemotaxis protein
VRTILNDIQKATGVSVQATDQGTRSVESVVDQSSQAGESIVALANTIDDSAQAAMQIAASSHEQLVGMDQVAAAMESINEATAQNVKSVKVLEVSAGKLYDLGQKLIALVEQYKV